MVSWVQLNSQGLGWYVAMARATAARAPHSCSTCCGDSHGIHGESSVMNLPWNGSVGGVFGGGWRRWRRAVRMCVPVPVPMLGSLLESQW